MATSFFWKIFGVYGDVTQFVLGTYLIYKLFSFAWATLRRCLFPDPEMPPALARFCGGIMPLTTRFMFDLCHPDGRRRQQRGRYDLAIERRKYDAVRTEESSQPENPILRNAPRADSPSAPPDYVNLQESGLYPTLRRFVTFRGPRVNRLPSNTGHEDQRDAAPMEGGSVAPALETEERAGDERRERAGKDDVSSTI
jgi:hypothetical protein